MKTFDGYTRRQLVGMLPGAFMDVVCAVLKSIVFWALLIGFVIGRASAPSLPEQAQRRQDEIQARKDAAQAAAFALREMADQIDRQNPR